MAAEIRTGIRLTGDASGLNSAAASGSKSVQALGGQLEITAKQADKLSRITRDPTQFTPGLEAAGTSAEKMGTRFGTAGAVGERGMRRVREETSVLAPQTEAAGTSADKMGKRFGAAAALGERGMRRVREETTALAPPTERVSGGLTGIQRAIAGVVSAAAGWQLGRMALATADDMTVLQSRLKLVTGNTNELTYVQQRLFAISQQSRVGFTDLGSTYAQIARATADLGFGQERILGVTESIGQAMAIGGGSAASMNAALIQLSQGLASGTLRGEELNSVMEQTPRLAQAIAQGMGVSLGQLRALGQDGKLTAQQVIEALEKAAPALRREFEQVTPTISGAFTTLKNSSALFISEFDKATGSSRGLSGALTSVAGAVSSLAGSITSNQAAWNTIASLAAGAAAVGALALGWAGVAAGVARVGAAIAANPALALLLGAGGVVGAVASGQAAFNASEGGAQGKVDALQRRFAALDEAIARAGNDGDRTRLQANRDRVAAKLPAAQVQLGGFDAERNQARDQFRAGERQDSARTEAAVLFAGAKPLEEVRKYAKLGVDIQREAYDQSVEIAKSYQNRIKLATNDEQRVALTKEMNARLIQVDRDAKREIQTLGEQGAAQAKQLAEAQFGQKKARAELAAAFERNAINEQVRTNEQLYRLGLVDVDAYYTRKAALAENDLAITERLTQGELAQARAIAASARRAEDKATAQARVLQLERELLELQGKRAAVRAEPGDERAARLKTEQDQLRNEVFRERRANTVDGYNQAAQTEQDTKALRINAVRDPDARARAQLDSDLQQRRDRIGAIADPDARQLAEDRFADYVVAKNAELAERLKPGYQQMLEDWADTSRLMRETYNTTVEGMLRSGEDEFVRSGGNLVSTTKAIAKQIEQELLRLAYRQNIGKTVAGLGEQLLGQLFGGGGGGNLVGATGNFARLDRLGSGAGIAGGGGLLEDLLSLGVFHTGGVVGGEVPASRRVSMAAFKGAPRFHTGGIAGNEVPIIAEKGEGIFTQEQMKSLAPVGAGTGSVGQVVVNMNVTNNSNAQVQVTGQRQRPDGGVDLDVLVSELEGRMGSNVAAGAGPLARGMEDRYGLRTAVN